jgi:hypothetical protein
MHRTSRIHKRRVESEVDRLILGEIISNNLWEESRWIDWRGNTINCVNVEINDIIHINRRHKMIHSSTG